MDLLRAAKPQIVALLLVSTLAAMLMAGERRPLVMAAVLAALTPALAGAAILNNYLERESDGRMRRTRRRPTASGAVSPRRALVAGSGATLAGVAAVCLAGGALAAAFAAAGAFYYVVVYTMLLKPRTAMSAVPGGFAGVFPPLVGWAATGAHWSIEIVFLCVLIFMWSPPHFWALAFTLKNEYVSSGIPTPAVAYGDRNAALQILAYVTALTAVSLAPAAAAVHSLLYLGAALAAGVTLWYMAWRLVTDMSRRQAWLFYKVSGPYLAVIMLAMVLDGMLQTAPAHVAHM